MSNTRRAQMKPRQIQPAKRETVVIAYLHPGQTSAYFTTALLLTCLYDRTQNQRIVDVYQEWSSANISGSRNNLTQRFLETSDADWLLWIDADMAWEPTAVDQLIDSADPKDRPIVGGLCFGAVQDRLFSTIYNFAEIDGKYTTVRGDNYPTDTMVKCDATGAAFLLVHRTVIAAMAERKFSEAFPFFEESSASGMPMGEDLTFCVRAAALGLPVFVNTAVKIGHHKSIVLTEDLFMRQRVDANPTWARGFGCCKDCGHHRGQHRPECADCGCLEHVPSPYAHLDPS